MSDLTLSGRLTADKYAHWYKYSTEWTSVMQGIYAEHREQGIQRQFELLSESDFILDNFFKLESDFQIFVEEFAGDEYAPADIEAFARLALLVQESIPDLDSNEDSQTIIVSLMYKISCEATAPDYDSFFDTVYDDCFMMFENSPNLAKPVLVMLAGLHGASRVLSVLERWSQEDKPGTVGELIAVTRNWESVKGYPISWAVNLVRADSR